MAYIGAHTTAPNLANLSCTFCDDGWIRAVCGNTDSNNVANYLLPQLWDNIFAYNGFAELNDGVVSLKSQLNASTSVQMQYQVSQYIHSQGLLTLDFVGPTELPPGPIPTGVVDLLNEAKAGSDFQY